ncbi:histidine kinase [Kribbella sp. CA-245084]|uniref:histidine kinase n=1 Tax=Kribbella sp. CA-245084 TaxID=3239940 RepID=UPI003D8F6C92
MRLAWWDGKVRTLIFDVLLAAAVTAGTLLDITNNGTLRWYGAVFLGVLFCGMVIRRRFPLLFAVLAPVSQVFPSVPVSIAAYTAASRKGLHWYTAVSAVIGAIVIVVWPVPGRSHLSWAEQAASVALFVGGPVLLGLWAYQRRALLAALRDRADQAERERDLRSERAVTDERRRIAREMHDVVAHRVSAIALQSGALTMTAPDEQTEKVAEIIRRTSTSALTELREILQVLRDELPWEPGHVAPSIGGVPVLVADAESTGQIVSLDLADPVPEASSAVGRAAYRVVQEALTNAAKHAPGVRVTVRIVAEGDDLTVEVTNPRGVVGVAVPGSGYGLLGMRERVSLAGGRLETGWDGGVFRVKAVFGLKAEE